VHSIFAPLNENYLLQVVLNEALRERHMGYLQGLKSDDAVNKNPNVFRGFDIFKITEGSDPDSRHQEIPVSLQLIFFSRLKFFLRATTAGKKPA
jgi:hypothetical protein